MHIEKSPVFPEKVQSDYIIISLKNSQFHKIVFQYIYIYIYKKSVSGMIVYNYTNCEDTMDT